MTRLLHTAVLGAVAAFLPCPSFGHQPSAETRAADPYQTLVELKQRVAAEPDSAEPYFYLGTLYSRMNQHDLALAYVERALDIDRENNAYNNLKGAILFEMRRYQDALEAFRQALDGDHVKDPHKVWRNIGHAYEELNDGEEAIKAFRRSLALDPEDARTAYALGKLYQESGALDEAIELLATAARLQPDWASAHAQLGVALARAGQADRAIETLSRAVELAPEDTLARYNLAQSLLRQGRVEEGRRQMAEYEQRRRVAEELEHRRRELTSTFQTALARLEEGALEEAGRLLRQVLENDPGLVPAHYSYGFLLMRLEEYAAAIRSFEKALQLDPLNAGVYSYLAAAYEAQGDPQAALEPAQRAVMIFEGNPDYHRQLAQIYLKLNRSDKALEHFRRAVEIRPGDESLYLALASIYVNLNRFDDAVPTYRKVLELRPDSIDAHGALGSLYLRRGLLAEAEAEFRAILDIDPGHVEAQAQLAGVHLAAGRFLSAAEKARRVLDSAPEHLQARYTLATALIRAGEGEAGRQELVEYQRLLDTAQSREHNFRELMAFNQDALRQLEAGDQAAAVALFRQAVEKFPDLALPHVTLGLALIKVGEAEEAIRHLSKALELGFDFPELHQYLSEQYAALGRTAESERERAVYLRMHDGLRKARQPGGDHKGAQ